MAFSQSSHWRLHRTPLALALMGALGLAPLAASAASIMVSSVGDTDPTSTATCTLRQAIATMNHGATAGTNEGTCRSGAVNFGSNDTITFASSAFPTDGSGTITLAHGQLTITNTDLAIDASANSKVTIDANQLSRLINDSAANGGALHLSNLTLTGGYAANADCAGGNFGGGICIPHAKLSLDHSAITNCSAYIGGAVFSLDNTVTLTDSTLSGNSATRAGGGLALYASALIMTNSTLSGNSAGNYGGGILADYGPITLTNSTLNGNSAGENGGAINKLFAGTITLTNSTLSGNSADSNGGGISTRGCTTVVTGSTISNNSTNGLGGGMFANYDSTITLTNSTLSGNSAISNGGGIHTDGILTIANSTLSGNSADANGGGIFVADGDYVAVTLINSTISANSAGHDGGIVMPASKSVTAYNSIIAGNTQTSGSNFSGSLTIASHNNLIMSGDPKLGVLQDNGGPTLTMLPQVGSPAIDTGSCDANTPPTDQRGFLRPNPGDTSPTPCDIGAVEANSLADDIFKNGFEALADDIFKDGFDR